jgi:hypothetical protein
VGGFLQVFEYGYSGLRFGSTSIQLDPSMSPQLHGLTLNNLQWQGRVFTVTIGPQSTQLQLSSGPAMSVKTPAGTQTVAPGGTLTVATRRPDEQPTSDLARCESVTASSYVPGDEPAAAVDGSSATPWEATAPQATLTVQLSETSKLRSVTVTRGSTRAFRYMVETSTDGSTWKVLATSPSSSTGTDQFTFAPTKARFVRLDFPGGNGATTPAIDELSVGG